ncbi:hypothetical protein [Actinacidiphila oryziradicis]|uniref:hypothetical protein n=1 Tax=Actinacidiphila oryziradicis TaxID=2571141 RepID=UPI001FEB2686|nr:hypothetical protein [Actinacidiphila oryziradicis]
MPSRCLAGWSVRDSAWCHRGSSHEHAAITPRHLGLRLDIARSYAHHWQIFTDCGVLPLACTDEADYERRGPHRYRPVRQHRRRWAVVAARCPAGRGSVAWAGRGMAGITLVVASGHGQCPARVVHSRSSWPGTSLPAVAHRRARASKIGASTGRGTVSPPCDATRTHRAVIVVMHT